MRSAGTSESKKKTVRSWIQGMNRQRWAVVLLTGLLLMVISLPVSKANSDTAGEKHLTASQTTQEQKSELEEKLENLLENAEGVGKVKVMLMEEGGQGVYSAGETEVTGVLIVAEGADNAVTVQKIQQAVMALFQIDAHKIRIIKMK